MATDERTRRIRRAARKARIIERLDRLDDATLDELDRLTRQAVLGQFPAPEAPSRRQFLKAAAAGGALVALTGGLAVGYGYWSVLRQDAIRMSSLVALYEEMDRLGLDAKLGAALVAIGNRIGTLRAAAESLRAGLQGGRAALLEFQSGFAPLQAGLRWLRQSVTTLSQRLLALENSVNGLLELTGPLTETVGGFLRWILDRLPGSAAEQVRDGLERLGEVVSPLPDLVEGLHQRILEPLEAWFDARSAEGLGPNLVDPLLTLVLDPAEALLDQIVELFRSWEEEWAGSLQQTLERRQAIREQIRRLTE